MLRSDARDNRDRVLVAARSLFSERGIDVTMREVARRAGVGSATLYRRFPTRQSLVEEVFGAELDACSRIVRDGCADPDPWNGFCSVVLRISELNVRNRGFVDAFMAGHPGDPAFGEHRTEMLRLLRHLVRRAKAGGRLRADLVVDDVVAFLLAGRGLAAIPPGSRVAAARRHATLALDGFRASAQNSPLPRSPRLAPTVTRRRPVAG